MPTKVVAKIKIGAKQYLLKAFATFKIAVWECYDFENQNSFSLIFLLIFSPSHLSLKSGIPLMGKPVG